MEQLVFSRKMSRGKVRAIQRFFEILPGAVSWSIIIGMFVLLALDPVIAALIVIAFVFSWFLRLLHGNILLLLSFIRLYAEKNTDWMERIRRLSDLEGYIAEMEGDVRRMTFRQRLSLRNHLKDLRTLASSGSPPPRWSDVYHLVIFPVARERRMIFEPGVASIAAGQFPAKKILMVLAVEERAPDVVKEEARAVVEKYRGSFLDFLLFIHPDGIPNEARVKGANITYAASKAAAFFDSMGIPYENVIASCFDADTVSSPEYFACLTYHFLICPKRTRASFQPIPVYWNNYWEATGFSRVLDMFSSLAMMRELTYPAKLTTFSSHSLSFKALADVDYWPVDVISDDTAIFWKALIQFKGDYRVVPMYTTVSMDLNQAETWWKTVVNVYKQRRRWAYGAELIPIVITEFLLRKDIPLGVRLVFGYRLIQMHVSWATWPFLLSLMSWLPAILIALTHSHSVVRYSEPRILSVMYQLSYLGFGLYVVLTWIFQPREKGRLRILKRLRHALEWLLVPLFSIAFGGIPALDAQTRLLLGQYMQFWVTIKERKGEEAPTGAGSA